MQTCSAIMQNVDWDIYRYVVAVADAGSALAAAETLGVDGSTVIRRIKKFETEKAVRLFDRLTTGYVPTKECEDIINFARDIQNNVSQIERSITGQDIRLAGKISVTTTDSLLEAAVADILVDFCGIHPEIQVNLTVTNSRLSLSTQDADVAIRASGNPPEHLVGQKLASIALSVYGRRGDHAARESGLNSLPSYARWVGLGDSNSSSPISAWMDQHVPDRNIKLSADSFVAMRTCVRQGGGVAVLPCFLADQDADLIRLLPPIEELSTPLWLLVHPDVRRAAKINAFLAHMGQGLRKRRDLLEGRIDAYVAT